MQCQGYSRMQPRAARATDLMPTGGRMPAGSIWKEVSVHGRAREEGTPCNLSVAQTLMAVTVVPAIGGTGMALCFLPHCRSGGAWLSGS